MALKIVKGSIDRMFDKNLQDLVRGIRNHKEDEVQTHKYNRFSLFHLYSLVRECYAGKPAAVVPLWATS